MCSPPGEDPFLSGEYGVALISGMQRGSGNTTDPKYLKAAAIVKHSFDYDIEGNHGPAARQAFNAIVSADDQSQ